MSSKPTSPVRREADRAIRSRKVRKENARLLAVLAVFVVLAVAGITMQSGRALVHEERVLDCPVAADGTVAHAHDESCYDADGNLLCQLPEVEVHVHDESCYTEEQALGCGLEEGDGAHHHDDSCYDEEGNLVCGLEESDGHAHVDDCYEVTRTLTCGKEVVTEEHIHGQGCFRTVVVDDGEATGDADPQDGAADTDPQGEVESSGDAADAADEIVRPAQSFQHEFVDDKRQLQLRVSVEAPEGALPEGTTMRAEWVDTEADEHADVQAAIDGAVAKQTEGRIDSVQAVDITFLDAEGVEVEPAVPVTVTMASPQIADAAASPLLVHVESEREAVERGEELGLREVQVEGQVVDPLTDRQLVRRDIEAAEDELVFDAERFSVYAVVYTVDFHYSVDGKTYDSSIPGGGFVSFRGLVEAIGVVADDPATNMDEVQELINAVERVEFSDPSLVSVSRVDADTTVGGIKDALSLECEYSADLTKEQIAEINAQHVAAGDWALISLQPFNTEETLTVTMKNGDVWTVKVTDEQISTHVITADGADYLITVTYGPEAGIPNGATLTARELQPGTEEYNAHYAQMLAAVRGEDSGADPDGEMNAAFAEAGLEVVNPQSAVEVAFARFFDISIWKDGAEIEPLAPVQVEIQYVDPVSVDSNAEAEVIHFADDGIELIDPETDLNETSGEGISSFTFQQSSFSISATLLKYTTGIPNGNYLIVKGAKVNNVEHWYALKADGNTVEVTENGDTFTNTSNNADDAFWTFTNAGNGQYYIQNRSNGNNHLVLYSNIVGNWDQKINVTAPDGRKTVYLRNPNNTPLRFNGNTHKFVLGAQNDNAEQFYLARMTSEVPQGQGYNLTPAGETDLGDLNAWKNKVENSKIIVDKTADVVDYDNRIYQIDLKALSDITIIANKIDLELIVDTSRSMYFPANLSPLSGNYFTSIMGNDSHSLERQLSQLDRNQIYYFIGNGEQATVYALYYAASGTNLNDHTGDQCWKYVDASYMNPPDARSMNQSDRLNRLVGMRIDDLAYSICNQNRDGGGCRLYTASSSITRLAYLKEAVRIASEIVFAVDKNNRIGLVTFNSKANNPKFYDNGSKNGLYSAINNISLAGGTRQDLGLEAGTNLFNNSGRADAQKIAILITDGAPNMKDDNGAQVPSDTAWTMIGEKAGALKGTNSSNAKLYTLGLSLDMVGGNNQRHLDGLASEEDGVTRHFNASNGPAIASAIKNLIDTLVYDVTLEAEVTDVLDPAFYPVDQNGNPIAAGDYTDGNGKRYNWSKVTVDGAECWKITYYDQEVGRGEKNADNTIKTPGWQKSFYVKAKEDFLGGNEIETNRYRNSNNRVKQTKYVYTERGTNAVKKVDPPSNAPWGKFEKTPTVNVDELHLTEHSTEWTVYLGTEVKPEDQVKALWDEIKVKQVVKTGGTANNGTTITGGDKKWYSKTDTADTAAPDEGYSSLPINRYFTDADFNTLLNQLKTQNSVEKTINYSAYGHQPGTITVKLEKEIVNGAVDATGKAPGQHVADKDGTPAEKYTITVTYTPNKTDTTCNVGHVTTGAGADEVKSTNEHAINVVKKGLTIEKRDKDSNDLISSPATFKLYRPAITSAGETGTTLDGLSGSFYEVATLTTSEGTSALDSQLPELRKLPDGQHYYLVETSEPSGYIKLTVPVQVDVSVSDGAQTKPYETTEGITTLVNIAAPTASVTITSDSAEAGEAANDTFVIKIKNEAMAVDITIHKVDDKSNNLSGATFKLMNGPEIVPVSNSGTGVVVEPKISGQTVTIEDNTFTIPAGGVTIKNLKVSAAEYEIVEVSPPPGYVITDSTPARFKVTAGQVTDEHHIAGVTYTPATNDFVIPNTPGVALPAAGGPGSTASYLIGVALAGLGAASLVMQRRRKAA